MSQFINFAQNYKFGKVSKEELQEAFYPKDSTADAAYIYKSRQTYYDHSNNSGFEIINKFHVRLKIYNKEGFKYANFEIPFYKPEKGKSEKVTSIKAYTYSLNSKGKIDKTKLSNKNIFDETISKFRHLKKITMPNLKEGSVIEIIYKVTSPYTNYIDDLQFQYSIPVKKLDYSVETPEWLIFSKKIKGYYMVNAKETKRNGSINLRRKERETRKTTGSNGGWTTTNSSWSSSKLDLVFHKTEYQAENIPALKDNEPFVSNIKNYRGGVKFELVGTRYPNTLAETFSNSWESVSKEIYKASNFGGELDKKSYYKEVLPKILEGKNTEVEKVLAIYQYVKERIKWNNYNGIFSNDGVKKAFKERTGNVADINLMLTSMLRSSNLKADPVLVSTRANGIPFSPTIDGFNYVISLVELTTGQIILLDATEPYSSPNILPKRALNWNGRRISANGLSSWVQLTATNSAVQENNIMIDVSEDLTVKGLARTKFFKLDALTYRKNNNHLTEESVVTNLEDRLHIEVEDFKILNDKILGKPVIRNLKFSSEDLIEGINGKLYIEPMLFLSQHNNPFKLEERKFPVDFTTPWSVKNIISIKIPKGYKVESIPEALAIGMPDGLGVFKFNTTIKAGKINTVCVLKFNSAIIAPQYYSYLKDFYSKLVQKESEKVVLVKI